MQFSAAFIAAASVYLFASVAARPGSSGKTSPDHPNHSGSSNVEEDMSYHLNHHQSGTYDTNHDHSGQSYPMRNSNEFPGFPDLQASARWSPQSAVWFGHVPHYGTESTPYPDYYQNDRYVEHQYGQEAPEAPGFKYISNSNSPETSPQHKHAYQKSRSNSDEDIEVGYASDYASRSGSFRNSQKHGKNEKPSRSSSRAQRYDTSPTKEDGSLNDNQSNELSYTMNQLAIGHPEFDSDNYKYREKNYPGSANSEPSSANKKSAENEIEETSSSSIISPKDKVKKKSKAWYKNVMPILAPLHKKREESRFLP